MRILGGIPAIARGVSSGCLGEDELTIGGDRVVGDYQISAPWPVYHGLAMIWTLFVRRSSGLLMRIFPPADPLTSTNAPAESEVHLAVKSIRPLG